jgi:hypothetical protein
MPPVTNDEYLQSQVMPLLQPGEQVLQTAYMLRQPGIIMQMLFVGGLLLFLITKAYFAVLTNRRLIFIRTKMKFLSGGPQQMNLGVEQYDVRQLQQCTTSGLAANKSMTFALHGAPAQTLRINTWSKKIAGTKTFFEQVPQLINSGQLQQLAAGAPALPALPQPQAQVPHAQASYAQPQAAPQQPPQQQGFAPGARVMVVAQDGNRYPATIVQAGPGQYLCQMPNNQSYWFPAQSVFPG